MWKEIKDITRFDRKMMNGKQHIFLVGNAEKNAGRVLQKDL
jgi:hypothetical protein